MHELTKLKKEAHHYAALIWGGLHEGLGHNASMYYWLQSNTRTGHIATLNEKELKVLIKKLKRMAAK